MCEERVSHVSFHTRDCFLQSETAGEDFSAEIGWKVPRKHSSVKVDKQMHGLEKGSGRSGEPSANSSTLDRIEDVNKHCLAEFRRHWTCLDNNNQQLWQCRPQEWKLNKCVFDNLVRSANVATLLSSY
jgi:hypothetical protein